jgi:hypothetical protein
MGWDVRFGRSLMVAALFVAVSFAMVRPNLAEVDNRIPGNTGDPALVTWTLAWGSHALATDPGAYFDANIFWPNRHTLAYADTMAPVVPAYAAVQQLSDNWARTLTILEVAVTVLSLAGAYALARWLTGRRDAGILAAFAYTFSGYAVSQWGHLQLQTLGLLPLALLSLFRVLDDGRLRWAAALALTSVALALSSLYYGLIYAVAATIVVVGITIARRGRIPVRAIGALAVSAAVSAALVWPELHVRLQLADQGFRRGLVPGFALGARDFLRPAFGSYLWKPLERSLAFQDEAHRFFPGAAVALLAVLGIVAMGWGRRRRELQEGGLRVAPLVVLLVAGVAGVVLGVGRDLGPYRAIHDHVPGFANARVTSRFAVVATLAIALLAATGFTAIASRLPARAAALLAGVIGALVLAELAAPLPWAPLPRDATTLAVYRTLSRRPAGAVVELPMVIPHDAPYDWALIEAPRMVYSSIDWHPRLNGYSGFVPREYDEDAAVLNTFPAAEAIQRAKDRGIRYVVIHVGTRNGHAMFSDDNAARRIKKLPLGAVAERVPGAWLVDLGPVALSRRR